MAPEVLAHCLLTPASWLLLHLVLPPVTPKERQTGGFNPEMDEELEDASGNVYSRRVYEDLRRQGLL